MHANTLCQFEPQLNAAASPYMWINFPFFFLNKNKIASIAVLKNAIIVIYESVQERVTAAKCGAR